MAQATTGRSPMDIAEKKFEVAQGARLYLIIFIAFPVAVPVTVKTVNWSPVMFVGVVLLAWAYYMLYAHKVYDGPVKEVVHTY